MSKLHCAHVISKRTGRLVWEQLGSILQYAILTFSIFFKEPPSSSSSSFYSVTNTIQSNNFCTTDTPSEEDDGGVGVKMLIFTATAVAMR